MLAGGLRPAGPPYTLTRSPLRRLAPFAWLPRFRSVAGPVFQPWGVAPPTSRHDRESQSMPDTTIDEDRAALDHPDRQCLRSGDVQRQQLFAVRRHAAEHPQLVALVVSTFDDTSPGMRNVPSQGDANRYLGSRRRLRIEKNSGIVSVLSAGDISNGCTVAPGWLRTSKHESYAKRVDTEGIGNLVGTRS